MPFTTRDGIRLYWKLDGAPERPPLVLLNSIGTDMGLWDRAIPHLLPAFRLLRIDTRGHGASDAPEGDYTLAGLAADVLAVMDAAGIERAAVAGVSLGGMIAMEIALAAPGRVTGLGLVCTSAALDPAAWADRIALIRSGGMAAIADLAMGRFLAPGFVRAHPDIAAGFRAGLLAMAPAGYIGAGAAIRDMQLIDRISAIAAPCVVVAGDRDISTPFAGHGDRIAAVIPGAEVAHLDAAHLAPVEAPAELAAALRRTLLPLEPAEAAADTLFAAGLANRRRVLGDAWVDQSLARRTPFNADFQAMITRIAWHEVWGRPGLDERTRRLLVVVITAALGRWEEFRLHTRAGLARGGFTRDELKEALMQTAIYAGVPAANTAFAEAGEILKTLADEA
ncbi:bifunctional 3-oxoadipate enol-lactonase/4-carboxymuconolactone decarboxylase PcaDC [Chelatococcus reniformis]|uniref:3-oxoadipate enol-lactonase n=1 Tax=Chelatococcus reniformis TaxID=1494448 RepID=A0A916TWW3_9HYPH|nr:3-oxoadipate enol-lactonase [Chelatococcus reniformis]GGC47103.1 3-oxoadipate enol-lactonase [Chelatococcus reniformis]